jgi:hypothetical protein
MPYQFERAVREGGKVRTKTLPGGKYLHIVKDPTTGKWIAGEVKKKKGTK